MPIYTLGNASMPTTDANVVSRDAITQLQDQAAAGVLTPASVQAAATGTVSLGEQLAQQIAQPAPARGGVLNADVYDAPQQRTYTSGCGVPMGRPLVPGTGFAPPGSGSELMAPELRSTRRMKNLGLLAIGAAVAVGVLAATR